MARNPRLFCDCALKAGDEITLPDTAARHAVRVLRLRPGDRVTLFNGDGRDYDAELTLATRDAVRSRVLDSGDIEPAPALELHLALGVSRNQRMDFALQKATELGVDRITPLFTERSVIRLDEGRLDQRVAHWRQVTVAACEQSGRRRLPRIESPQPFGAWIERWHGQGLLLEPRATRSLADLEKPDGMVTLLVGPEGGLAPDERAAAVRRGMKDVKLGPRILRTETAPLAALAAMQVLWGDFR